MAITNFQFPGVELKQEFVSTPVTGVSQLGVVIVGKQYKLITPDLADEDLVISGWTTSQTSITTAELPGFDSVNGYMAMDTDYPVKVAVSGGTFENYVTGTTVGNASTKIGIATSGFQPATDKKSAKIKFDAKITGGAIANAIFGTRYPEVGDPVKVNTTPANITNIGSAGDEITVQIPVGGTTISGGTAVSFYAVEDAVLTTGTSATATGVTISSGAAVLGGSSAPAKALQAGTYDISVGYRATSTEYQGKLGAVASYDEIKDIFGVPAAGNPMALACLFALYAGVNNIVSFTATKSETLDGYLEALDFLERDTDLYSIVPMLDTRIDDNVGIINGLIGAVINTSEDSESKVRRTLWYGLDVLDENGSTNIDRVNAILGKRGNNSYRAQAVWADGAYFNGELIPNYVLAAAPAGMRSYEPSYRPISNLAYPFLSLKNANGFTRSQLEKLGKNGVWIIDNNYEGTPSNKKQVTTAVANNLNLDEESIVANADSIALKLCHLGEGLVGCSNISPALLKSLTDTITGLMDSYLVNLTGNPYIGPQLLSWSLDSIYQHPTILDHIYAVITCEPPKPFNRFVMTLRIV